MKLNKLAAAILLSGCAGWSVMASGAELPDSLFIDSDTTIDGDQAIRYDVFNDATLTAKNLTRGAIILNRRAAGSPGADGIGHLILSDSVIRSLSTSNVSGSSVSLNNVMVSGGLSLWGATTTLSGVSAGSVGILGGSFVASELETSNLSYAHGRLMDIRDSIIDQTTQGLPDGDPNGYVLNFVATEGYLRNTTLRGNGTEVINGSGKLTLENSRVELASSLPMAAFNMFSDPSIAPDITLAAGSRVVAEGDSWLMSQYGGSDGSLTVDNSLAVGDIRSDDGTQINLTVQNGGLLQTAFQYGATVTLNSNGRLLLTGDSVARELVFNGGILDFGDSAGSGFRTLTTQTLAGSGDIRMNTDVEGLQGDFLDVTGNASGNFTLDVANTGREPVKTNALLALVRTGGGDATFSLKDGAVDVGAWRYHLVKVGNEWGLAQPGQPVVIVEPIFGEPGQVTVRPIEQPEVPGVGEETGPSTSASTDALLSLASSGKEMFYGELNALNGRSRELQAGHQDGVWGTYLNNTRRLQGAWGSAYRLEQSGLMLGGDTSRDTAAGQLTSGVFASNSSGKVKHARGGESNVDSWGGGLYATLSGSDGWYASAVAKVNRVDSDLSARMTGGEGVKGSWQAWGYGLSLEGGRALQLQPNLSVTPYAALTGYRNQNPGVTLSNGMQASLGNGQSLQGELGVRSALTLMAGRTPVTPYLTAAVSQELVKSSAVQINEAYRFENDYRGTSGRISGGVSADITPAARVWLEAGYGKGEHNETPLSANLGVRVSF